jgi:acyl carrier protein
MPLHENARRSQTPKGRRTMSDRVVLGKIVQALAEYLKRDPASIKASYHLRDDLGLDSMAVIELLYKIEETFNLQIPDQDLAGLTTVGAVAGYVQKRLGPATEATSTAAKKSPVKTKKKKKK